MSATAIIRLGDMGAELLELPGQRLPNDSTVIDDENMRLMIHEYGSTKKHNDRREVVPFLGALPC